MVNHEGKANRRFPRGMQVQSAWNEAPFAVAIAGEISELVRRLVAGRR
jgi:hypothetical protein